jgi:hypothetical protein
MKEAGNQSEGGKDEDPRKRWTEWEQHTRRKMVRGWKEYCRKAKENVSVGALADAVMDVNKHNI